MFPVYLITCSHPEYGQHLMGYVGCVIAEGKTVKDRFSQHTRNGCAPYLYSAIRKYGKEHFTIEQIDAGNTPEQALELESWWIARLGTLAPHGYNLTAGGRGVTRPSDETRVKIGHASRNRSPEANLRISLAKRGNKCALGAIRSEETRRKIAQAMLGNKNGLRRGKA